jgi:hypothetical protein
MGEWALRPESERTDSFAMTRPVIPSMIDRQNSFVLCSFTGAKPVNGVCEEHKTDACLSRYVRYNYVFETMEHNFKEAMVQTRRDVS